MIWRTLLAAVVLVGLAAGAGWMALRADEAEAAAPVVAVARVETPVLSVRRVPETLVAPRRRALVAEAVAPYVAELPETSCLAVTDGAVDVVAHQTALPLAPASTQKLLTGAAILEVVGPDTSFRTVVGADTTPVDGRVEGDLWLIGGGDPILTTADYRAIFADPEQPASELERLADAVVAAGVGEVTGGVVGDGTRYDDLRFVPSWEQRYLDQGSAGPLSGLGVNDGWVTFAETERLVDQGVPSDDPPRTTAEVFTELLGDRGVVVGAPARSAPAPEQVVEVAALESPPASTVVAQMLRYSDNTTAELLLKELGVRQGGGGSTAAGAAALVQVLAAAGVPVEGVAPVDGSGLDLGNRLTCGALVDVLDRAGPGSQLADGLAVAGVSGTLRERMVGTPAEGRVVAKTGSLRHVVALAGFVESTSGRTSTFAYLVNGPEGEFLPERDQERVDELASVLATVPDVPVESVAPAPVGG